ncbi:GPR endopeptidase [Lysinibacillus sp. CNPSo 3705]|uniref:GPR endopeptidase n=1 Tax=Lysinibacillus sp. CNPSo 3705 TaxID=3028148 RepID=UPI002363EBDF|nr:GPR endopeptidase [Lysinibacillus sp. CNPSo 3705]MDD1503601.1 GPR endopeptidase [Lysinibacillus sp. CNPSo 3705]
MQNYNWQRTDLIDESEEVVLHRTKEQKDKLKESSGIQIEEQSAGRVKITDVLVDPEGEKQIGKKKGKYITLSVPTLTLEDQDGFEQLEKELLVNFKKMHESMSWKEDDKILIIGLGNRTITPDAIGPYLIDHLHSLDVIDEKFVMYAPGVTGQTGYETGEFVAALAERLKPKLIIVVDALATRASDRLCKTIQLTDTGIHPGSGVGNHRKEISYEMLGIPVTAIGIPTVVDAPVLIADAVEVMLRSIAARVAERSKPSSKLSLSSWQPDITKELDMSLVQPIFGEWATWSKEERQQLFAETFAGSHTQLMVTPKEADYWVDKYAKLVSSMLMKWANNL